jgi:hypothetical protein
MAKNHLFEGFPAGCLAELKRNRGFAIDLAWASGYLLEDVQREILGAVWAGEDLRSAVPARLGVRRLSSGQWLSADLHVIARFNPVAEGSITEMPTPKRRRSALVAGLAVDQGIGLRAAQKRVKKLLDQSRRQGDLFGGGEV